MEIGIFNLPISEGRLEQYKKAQDEDRVCNTAKQYCKEGWPEKKNLEYQLLPYWQTRRNLSLDSSGILLYGNRIVVPETLRTETLRKIHNGHQGIQ